MQWPDMEHKPIDETEEEAWLTEVIGLSRGPGDPDSMAFYPGEQEESDTN